MTPPAQSTSSVLMKDEIVQMNVGGHQYTTSLSTLLRDPESMLATMFGKQWKDLLSKDDSVFIDRDGRHFYYILNYLRDGMKVRLADDQQTLLELMNEVEYFQLAGLRELIRAKLHCPSRPIRVGEVVGWRPDAVNYYWRPFAIAMIHGIREGFLFDKVGKKYNDKETVAMCVGCKEHVSLSLITVFDYRLQYDEWEALKHHMRFLRGVVSQTTSSSCCIVDWANGCEMHVPNTALIPADCIDDDGDYLPAMMSKIDLAKVQESPADSSSVQTSGVSNNGASNNSSQ